MVDNPRFAENQSLLRSTFIVGYWSKGGAVYHSDGLVRSAEFEPIWCLFQSQVPEGVWSVT